MQDPDLDGDEDGGCGVKPAMSSFSPKVSCWFVWIDESFLTRSLGAPVYGSDARMQGSGYRVPPV